MEIFLSTLEQELPRVSREKLLSEIRKEVTEKVNTCRAVVPSAQAIQRLPPGELTKESALQQSSLLGRFEDSIRQHAHACAEKNLLEERLKFKSEKCKTLKEELETLRGQNQELASNTQRKITACTRKIDKLKKRMEEVRKTIDEQGMQAKRGRNTVITQTKRLTACLVQQKDQKIRELELKVKSLQERSSSSATDIIKKQHLNDLCLSINDIDLINPCYSQWKKIGTHLGFSDEELDCVPLKLPADIKESEDVILDNEYFSIMLEEWTKWYPGDSRGSTEYATYSNLQTALQKSGFGNVVRELVNYSDLVRFAEEKRPSLS